jgi:hypothetical protein
MSIIASCNSLHGWPIKTEYSLVSTISYVCFKMGDDDDVTPHSVVVVFIIPLYVVINFIIIMYNNRHQNMCIVCGNRFLAQLAFDQQ